MMQSFFVPAQLKVDEQGLSIEVDLEATNHALNDLLQAISSQGFKVESITPVISGVGQFQYGYQPLKKNPLSLLSKTAMMSFSYGLGYSYTSGFIVLARQVNLLAENNLL